MGIGGKTGSRREFLCGGIGAAAAFTIVPRHVLGAGYRAPSVGGCSGENIVGLCDVDDGRAGGQFNKFPKAKKYRDFRRMLDEMDKQIDAVTVATPDHTHALACMDAIRRGKHVYCEKPLAHSIYEIRELMKAARKHKVVTQLGNQGHSANSIRMFCEWIWDLQDRRAWQAGPEARDSSRSGLGPVAGTGEAAAIQSDVPSGSLARLAAFRVGYYRRLGLPRCGSGFLGAGSGLAEDDPG